MEKEKRVEAGMRVCVCVQMRAFRVAVMASGGCAFSRERISRPRFIGSDDDERSPRRSRRSSRPTEFFLSTSEKLKNNFFKKLVERFSLLPELLITFIFLFLDFDTDILWPVLRGSQPLQEAAHLHGEDH